VRRTAGEAWQEQARDHPLPRALCSQGALWRTLEPAASPRSGHREGNITLLVSGVA
jgi:hypothetical protein